MNTFPNISPRLEKLQLALLVNTLEEIDLFALSFFLKRSNNPKIMPTVIQARI